MSKATGSRAHARPTRAKKANDAVVAPGDARGIMKSFERFSASSKSLSEANLANRYPKKWIAFFDGEVKVSGESLEDVLEKVDKKRLPREEVIVRQIDLEKQTLILSSSS